MSDAALAAAGRLLARRVGLRLDPAIRGRLARCVKDGAAASGQPEPDYVATLEKDPVALQDLLNRITVQETSFFRHPDQFAALADHVLAQLEAPVRVWSAGCANGQEAYSLAMLLDESACTDWTVIASDLSTTAVARATRGRYSERELGGLSPDRRQRHLVATGDEWEVVARLRQRVEVVRHNLVADPPPFDPGTCSVVFCRNVLIYFREEEVLAFLERLATWLGPDAWLFLGYSESLWQVTDRFQLVRVGDAFIYRVPPLHSEAAKPHAGRRSRADAAAPAQPRRSRSAGKPERLPRPPGAAEAPDQQGPAPAAGVARVMAEGEAAISAGDHAAAVAAFRRAVYLDPDQPLAHLNLGLAFEASGDLPAGRRAYAAAKAALERCDTAVVELTLEGYRVDELRRLLQAKLGGKQ